MALPNLTTLESRLWDTAVGSLLLASLSSCPGRGSEPVLQNSYVKIQMKNMSSLNYVVILPGDGWGLAGCPLGFPECTGHPEPEQGGEDKIPVGDRGEHLLQLSPLAPGAWTADITMEKRFS